MKELIDVVSVMILNNKESLKNLLRQNNIYFSENSTDKQLYELVYNLYFSDNGTFWYVVNNFSYLPKQDERGEFWNNLLSKLLGSTTTTSPTSTSTGNNTAIIIIGGVVIVSIVIGMFWFLSKN